MKSFLKGLGIFFAVCLAFSLWYVILGVVIIVVIVGIILTIRKNRYFASPEFQTHRHTRQRIQRSRQLRTRHLHPRNLRARHLHQRHV